MGLLKNVFVLNIDNYRPDLTKWTLPTIKAWTAKIGANYREINNRMYPSWPITYEKMQVWHYGKDAHWNILVDADFMLHPNLPDLTQAIKPNEVGVHYKFDASRLFENDIYFERDGRDFGIAAGFLITSNLTHDLWTPLAGPPELHLPKTKRKFIIDEYCLSRNLAKFGLKAQGLESSLEIAQMLVHIGSEERTPEQRIEDAKLAEKLYQDWHPVPSDDNNGKPLSEDSGANPSKN